MSRRYGGQEDDICHGHIVMSWRKDIRENGRIKSFLFLFILIEFWDLYYSNIFLRVKIDERASLALVFISEALEVVNVILLSV